MLLAGPSETRQTASVCSALSVDSRSIDSTLGKATLRIRASNPFPRGALVTYSHSSVLVCNPTASVHSPLFNSKVSSTSLINST